MCAMPDEMLDAARSCCDAAEVYVERGETRSIRFENNKLKRITARQFNGVGLRIFNEGRIGFASTTDLREPGRLVEMAVESAEFGDKAVFKLPEQPPEIADVDTCDSKIKQVAPRDMVALGKTAMEKSRQASDEYLFSANISTKTTTQHILNTGGLDVEFEKSDMAASVEIQEVNDSGMLETYESRSWGQPFTSIEDITDTALEKMEKGKVIAPAKSEVMPMIFTPKSAGTLLSPIMTALNGKRVQKGSSILAGRLDEKIVDERIAIFDDPTVPFGPSSAPIDDEGLPVSRRPLIEQGVLKNYLLDLQTAALLGMESTASGHRSYGSRPSPSSTNTLVLAGSTPYKEMVEGLECGVIVDQTLGSGQSNTLAGEFSVNVALGFLVEDGDIQGRVKDCMVAGNVYKLLSRLEALGSEPQWMGSNCVPAICVGGIKLAIQD
ncbi:MAG: TldD/PmbA family protein [Planctomycetes bacterium]|nr:TldD/PmbA family protein [Planctomycetota bacterium]